MYVIPAHTDDTVPIDCDARGEGIRCFAMLQAQGFRPRLDPVIRTLNEHAVEPVADAQPEKAILAIEGHPPTRLTRFGNEERLGEGLSLVRGAKEPTMRS